MNPQEIIALLRRHLAAIAVIFFAAASLGYYLEHSSPGYTEAATVAFVAPKNPSGPFSGENSLLATNEVMAGLMMSPAAQQQVRQAGGVARYDVAQINLNNEEYPDYAYPYLSVTTTSSNPAEAQTTFSAVIKVLQDNLRTQQLNEGSKTSALIQLRTISVPPGPVAQTGSRKRVLPALLVLAMIAAFLVASFLDRHRTRLRRLLRRQDRSRGSVQRWGPKRIHPHTE